MPGDLTPDEAAAVERLLVADDSGYGIGQQARKDVRTVAAAIDRLRAEVAGLADWKATASAVLAGWEEAYDALGRPGALGAPKYESALAEVLQLRAEVENLRTTTEEDHRYIRRLEERAERAERDADQMWGWTFHLADCPKSWTGERGVCRCGLEAAHAAHDEAVRQREAGA